MFKLLKWERAQDLTNDGLGAPFALPKEPVNLLMWSHYGDQYEGNARFTLVFEQAEPKQVVQLRRRPIATETPDHPASRAVAPAVFGWAIKKPPFLVLFTKRAQTAAHPDPNRALG